MRTIEEIDQTLKEFDSAIKDHKNNPKRFIRRGIEVRDLKDELHQRLEDGWAVCERNPSRETTDFWLELEHRYRACNDLLFGWIETVNQQDHLRVAMASVIFDRGNR